jgi:hypothetical protein
LKSKYGNTGLVGSETEHSVAHKDIHQELREDGVWHRSQIQYLIVSSLRIAPYESKTNFRLISESVHRFFRTSYNYHKSMGRTFVLERRELQG